MYYKTIDLCAGIGGIRKGFEMTGKFKNVLSAEIDKYACKTYEHLFGDNPYNDLTSKEFKERVKETKYHVLLAGFPCQPFSRSGLELGFEDKTKGTIFFDIAEILKATKPRAFLLENVANIISHDKNKTIQTIIETLDKELNYQVIGVTHKEDGSLLYNRTSFVRNTKDFGLPQNRPRAYFIGFSRDFFSDKKIKKITEKQLPKQTDSQPIFKTVSDVLEKKVAPYYYLSSGYLETLKKHKQREHQKGNGFGYCVVNSESHESKLANTIMATGGSGKERNLIYQPVKDYLDMPLKGKYSNLNKDGIRMMTPTEWGRLQGFIGYGFLENGKETFSFPEGVARGQQYKQFGNSVSIPVIKCLADFMLECFDLMK
ncbi:DNA (cytosine-5-)-methyltransferase [Treponema sp.]|uniref:DNA (cytosine-5-)-methyltransferase n=1 Tax=Treponema sp. TaxID=166 RepID=UPI002599B2E9|nr:DNA (cytosine-5-)-methyltransferase [uncultured Treponema sp.]